LRTLAAAKSGLSLQLFLLAISIPLISCRRDRGNVAKRNRWSGSESGFRRWRTRAGAEWTTPDRLALCESDLARLTEESREEWVIGGADTFTLRSRRSARLCLTRHCFDQLSPLHCAISRERHDGEIAWLSIRATPRFASDGTFLGYIGSAHGHTTSASAQEERLRAQHNCRAVLRKRPAIEQAAPRRLRAMGECLGWYVARSGRVDRESGRWRGVELCINRR